MQIQIAFDNVENEADLFEIFGRELELGGPDGNFPVKGPNAGRGWGMNWDALADSLSSLDAGGIWGTSRRFEFPLKIILLNTQEYANSSPEDFNSLIAIMRSTVTFYDKAGLTFEYELA